MNEYYDDKMNKLKTKLVFEQTTTIHVYHYFDDDDV